MALGAYVLLYKTCEKASVICGSVIFEPQGELKNERIRIVLGLPELYLLLVLFLLGLDVLEGSQKLATCLWETF